MCSVRPLAIAVGLILSGQVAPRRTCLVIESTSSKAPSTLSSRRVERASADAKTLHERRGTIRELEWCAPYVGSESTHADPVREIAFTFHNDALYQVIVNYDRDRTEGLTNRDIIGSISGSLWHARARQPTGRDAV